MGKSAARKNIRAASAHCVREILVAKVSILLGRLEQRNVDALAAIKDARIAVSRSTSALQDVESLIKAEVALDRARGPISLAA